jgi:phosphate/sulfate permease
MEWNERNISILYFLVVFVVFFILALGIIAIIFMAHGSTVITIDVAVIWFIFSFLGGLGAGLLFTILRLTLLSAFKKERTPEKKNKTKQS